MSNKKNDYWGYHLMLDCASCDLENMTSIKNIYDFTKNLVKDINMIAYGEPLIVYLGSNDKAGYSLVQLIETSNICGHFCDETRTIYLDVFSCKPYKNDTVIDLVKKYFKAKSIKSTYITRQA